MLFNGYNLGNRKLWQGIGDKSIYTQRENKGGQGGNCRKSAKTLQGKKSFNFPKGARKG
jgi:hypothetical protein